MPDQDQFEKAFKTWRASKPYGLEYDAYEDLGAWAEKDPEFIEKIDRYFQQEGIEEARKALAEHAFNNTPGKRALKTGVAFALPTVAMGLPAAPAASALGGVGTGLGVAARLGMGALNSGLATGENPPELASTENIANLFGLGGRLATSKTALGKWPGLVGAADSILGTTAGRAINQEPPQASDFLLPIASGTVGHLIGRASNALKTAPHMKESDFIDWTTRKTTNRPLPSSAVPARAPDQTLELIQKRIASKDFSRIPEAVQELRTAFQQSKKMNPFQSSKQFKRELLGWFQERSKVPGETKDAVALLQKEGVADAIDDIFGGAPVSSAGGDLKPSELLSRFMEAREALFEAAQYKDQDGIKAATIGRILIGGKGGGWSFPVGEYLVPWSPAAMVNTLGSLRGKYALKAIEQTVEALKNPGSAARPTRDLARALARVLDPNGKAEVLDMEEAERLANQEEETRLFRQVEKSMP